MNLTLNGFLDKRKSDSVCLKFVHTGPPLEALFLYPKDLFNMLSPILKDESEVKWIFWIKEKAIPYV